MMKLSFINILLSVLVLAGCSGKKKPVVTIDLKPVDYFEYIDVTGAVQAVNSTPLVVGRIWSNLKVIHLVKEGAYVKKGDTVCIIGAPELAQSFESISDELKKLEAESRSLDANSAMQLSILEAQVETNNAQMEMTNLDSVQIRFAPAVKKKLMTLEMEKVAIEKLKLQKKLVARKKIDSSERIQMRSRIAIQRSQQEMIRGQINSLTMLAPVDGMVMHVEAPQMFFLSSSGSGSLGGKIDEGSLVFSGMSVATIPDLKLMQVISDVPEADYKRIKENQKVLIRVEAASNLETTGKVTRKSLAGKRPDQETTVKSYEITISIDSCHLKMKPGLSATCRIVIDQVKDTVVVPAAAVFQRDSSKIVYVAQGKQFIPVVVETGLSNSSMTIISKGLSGNERIALVEPADRLIRSMPKEKKTNQADVKKDSVSNISKVNGKNDTVKNK